MRKMSITAILQVSKFVPNLFMNFPFCSEEGTRNLQTGQSLIPGKVVK